MFNRIIKIFFMWSFILTIICIYIYDLYVFFLNVFFENKYFPVKTKNRVMKKLTRGEFLVEQQWWLISQPVSVSCIELVLPAFYWLFSWKISVFGPMRGHWYCDSPDAWAAVEHRTTIAAILLFPLNTTELSSVIYFRTSPYHFYYIGESPVKH